MSRTPAARPAALLALLAAAAGCADHEPERRATAAFERFQDALFAGDHKALAATLSGGSLEALGQLPLERAAGKQRLQVVGVRAAPPEYEIEVRDPNEGGRASTFVVAREEGRYVVDLVATAGHHQVVDADAKRGPRLVPRALSPRERAQAEAMAAKMQR